MASRHTGAEAARGHRYDGGRRRRVRRLRPLVAALIAVVGSTVTGPAPAPAGASPGQEYSGPYFGDGNFPPGCIRDWDPKNPANKCFHMKTGLSGLDSPKVDVLVLVAASPAAERETRIARQAIEMWEGGIDYLAPQMGLDWLAEGMEFHITAATLDPSGGGEFTTYPVVDPEIVVVVGQPGALGIGTDPGYAVDSLWPHTVDTLGLDESWSDWPPASSVGGLQVLDDNGMPCHQVSNPFDLEYWEGLPGFDSHHDGRSGTYVEDCGGGGGNVCFSVNTGLDFVPDRVEEKSMFDLVAHETGHCMSLGHVGDGGEGMSRTNQVYWGPIPYTDIMSYSEFPARRTTCASTLDVEVIALRMSNYLDVNGDGGVDPSDRLLANDQVGIQNSPLQVQHPDDHHHASGTGSVHDCPQPDLGLVPSGRTDWTPEPVDTVDHLLEVSAPADGAVSDDGRFDVAGRVERRRVGVPAAAAGSTGDAEGDSTTPYNDLVGLDVELTDSHLVATMHLAEMWDQPGVVGPGSYTVLVNGHVFRTWRDSNGKPYYGPRPDYSVTWDVANRTITFRIPRAGVHGYEFDGRYRVSSSTSPRPDNSDFHDDVAPEGTGALLLADPAGCAGCTDGDGPPTGQVHLYADGVHAASTGVDTSKGSDSFSLPVDLAEGAHVLRVDWEDGGEVVAGKSFIFTHNTDDDGDGVPNTGDACPGFDDRADEDDDGAPDACDPDLDGDGVANETDNCAEKANPGQADMDGDGAGDTCDADMDGDGFSNGRERSAGTDPADPRSHPPLPGLL